MSDRNQEQKIVKNKVYPISAAVDVSGVKHTVEIVRLTNQGFIARLKTAGIVYVGKYYDSQFEIPVMRKWINSQVRVMKTYDRAVDPKNHLVERLAEFRFHALTEEGRGHIVAFLNATGQK